ncbi:MAG: HepT-like ribonuclease domain-containing protein [Pseudomonadota bacterium]
MRQRDPNKYLFDIAEAVVLLRQFTAGKTFGDYQDNPLLRSAVERQFEIVGEALNQLGRFNPELLSRISDARRIIAFRNVLVHAYASISEGHQ